MFELLPVTVLQRHCINSRKAVFKVQPYQLLMATDHAQLGNRGGIGNLLETAVNTGT